MASAPAESPPPLIFFADDWGRHPSSSQHLTRHLLGKYEVHWINTIGTRTPAFNWSTLSRGWEKLRQWSRPPVADEGLPPHLHVMNPRMWPWFSRQRDRSFNRYLLTKQLQERVASFSRPPIVVAAVPIAAVLLDQIPVDRWVYYCVDDFSTWLGLDGRALRELEEELVSRADAIVAVSDALVEKMQGLGRESHLLTHGVELAHWEAVEQAAPLSGLAELPRPLVGFWGLVDRKIDLAFVERLAESMQEGSILMVGPRQDPDPALLRHPRLHWRDAVDYQELPRVAAAVDVLVMPYADIPANRASQPLKLKEYLATGRPVVVRDLPANCAWEDCLDLAHDAEEFARRVLQRLESGLPAEQKVARERLRDEDWAAKAEQFEHMALAPPVPTNSSTSY